MQFISLSEAKHVYMYFMSGKATIEIYVFLLHEMKANRSRSRESGNFSKSKQFNYQKFPCDLTKDMNTHTLCFCPIKRKFKAFENLNRESQQKKQRTSNFIREIQVFFIF